MNFGPDTTVLNKIREVLVAFPGVEEAVIYASRATGTHREGPDIDLSLKGNLSFQDLLQIQVELDDKMLPYTFDISYIIG